MRLWHKDIITSLPRQQLVAQWRELSSIATKIRTTGSPNHVLVNKIMDYPLSHFFTYAALVKDEMHARGYITRNSVWDNILSVGGQQKDVAVQDLYADWHNREYLKICYYNLYEKYLCGGVSEDEWKDFNELLEWSDII